MKIAHSNSILLMLVLLLAFQFGCKQKKEEQKVIEGPQIVTSSKSGININYTVHSEGEHALVFVHGWSCDQTYWEKQVPYFKKNYKVVTLDLGGHGKSGKNRTDWTMEAFARDVVDVINTIEYDSLSIIGHSMGAVVALNVIDKLPKTPNNIVFVDYFEGDPSKTTFTKEAVAQMTATIQADFKNTTKAFVKKMFLPTSDSILVDKISTHMASANPELAIPAMQSMLLNDLYGNFQNLNTTDVNTHIINSDKRQIDKFYASMGITSHVIKDSGHFLMIEKPKEFNSILESILR